jgi:hypothetical protein
MSPTSSAPRRRSARSVSLSISGARRLVLLRVAIYSILPDLAEAAVDAGTPGHLVAL